MVSEAGGQRGGLYSEELVSVSGRCIAVSCHILFQGDV